LLASLTALGLAATGQAQTVTLQRAPSGHLTLPVQIDNTGPYTFLLDTGASNTAIAQPVAEALGFHSAWEDVDDVQSLTTLFSAERFTLHDLRIAGIEPMELNSVVIPVADDEPRPVAGLLGADAMTSPHYRIDFAAGELTLDAPLPEHADGRVHARNLLIGWADLARGTRGVRVMLDSGSARTLVNERLRSRVLNRSGGVVYHVGGVEGRRLAEDDVEAHTVVLRELAIGGLCLNSVIGLQADLDIFQALDWGNMPAMVIGMDVLEHAIVTIDRDTGTFELSAADPADACPGDQRVQVRADDEAGTR
tara:strand:+ start:1035 stop:1958 length:924 start_codon:yes stop_codon:yes gene_type:complete